MNLRRGIDNRRGIYSSNARLAARQRLTGERKSQPRIPYTQQRLALRVRYFGVRRNDHRTRSARHCPVQKARVLHENDALLRRFAKARHFAQYNVAALAGCAYPLR
jgi:hypothetical protein